MWQSLLGTLLALGLAALLVRHLVNGVARRRAEPFRLFAQAAAVLENATPRAGDTAGSYVLAGTYQGVDVRVTALADTLALRKLPSLWLMVTLPGALPVSATLDLMMRPAAATTFSNFDHLAFTIPTPADFPDQMVIRSDAPGMTPPASLLARHIGPLRQRQGKELLITPKGLRLVMLMAEADRVRYGVLRQADFGETIVDAAQLRLCLDALLALREDIFAWHAGLS